MQSPSNLKLVNAEITKLGARQTNRTRAALQLLSAKRDATFEEQLPQYAVRSDGRKYQ